MSPDAQALLGTLALLACAAGVALWLRPAPPAGAARPDRDRTDMALRFAVALVVALVLVLLAVWLLRGVLGLTGEGYAVTLSVIVAAIGWGVTFGLREFEAFRAREQLRRDVLIALRSEIFTALQTLDQYDWSAEAARVQARILAGGAGATAYHPFTTSESPPVVFQALADRITVLAEAEVATILRFYAALTDLATLVRDCRDPVFAALSPERRVAVHRRLTDTRRAALYWAVQAVYRINCGLGVVRPEEIDRSGRNQDIVIDPEARP